MIILFKAMYFIERAAQEIEGYCLFLAIAPIAIAMYIYISYQQFKKEENLND